MDKQQTKGSNEQPPKPFSNLASAIEMLAVLSLAYLWGSAIWSDMRWSTTMAWTPLALVAIAGAFVARWYGWTLAARMAETPGESGMVENRETPRPPGGGPAEPHIPITSPPDKGQPVV
jgi:hypothetical protein